MILSICDVPEVLKIFRLIKIALLIIRIVVPIILLVFGCKTFMAHIASNDDIKKPLNKLVIMVVSAICVFMVPTFINLILDLTNSDLGGCLEFANSEGISKAYYNYATKYVTSAKTSLSKADYNKAKSYLKNLSDDDKEAISEELEEVETYIEIVEEMDTITTDNYSTLTDTITKEIESVEDEEVKAKLTELLDDKKDVISKKIEESEILQYDQNGKYNSSTAMTSKTLSEILEENGSSVEELNEKIQKAVIRAGVGKREAVTAAAYTLINTLADYGYKVPYYWGGVYANLGVRSIWGQYHYNDNCDRYNNGGTEEWANKCHEIYSNLGLDCNGFVHWVVIQAMQDSSIAKSDVNGGTTYNTTNDTALSSSGNKAICEVGDLIISSGHYTIVVGIDDDNSRYIIAQASTNGVGLANISYTQSAHWCRKVKGIYKN